MASAVGAEDRSLRVRQTGVCAVAEGIVAASEWLRAGWIILASLSVAVAVAAGGEVDTVVSGQGRLAVFAGSPADDAVLV